MADFNTQGGYFSPKGWMEVNAGGSHKENPNGGVQIGVDEQGIPNMLEEGEPVYDDYVYSDNIKADAKILKKMNLPEKLGGKLYSEIAEELCKEAEERPLDPISNNGLREMLGRLADSQEEQKARTERRKLRQQLNNLSPEELMQIQSEMQGGQEMMGQPEAPIAGMQEMPTQEMQQPMMPMANGGNLIRRFDGGSPGDLSYVTVKTGQPGQEISYAIGIDKIAPLMLKQNATQEDMQAAVDALSDEDKQRLVDGRFPTQTLEINDWLLPVGGVVGGAVGMRALGAVGKGIYKGGKAVAEAIAPTIEKLAPGVAKVAKVAGKGIGAVAKGTGKVAARPFFDSKTFNAGVASAQKAVMEAEEALKAAKALPKGGTTPKKIKEATEALNRAKEAYDSAKGVGAMMNNVNWLGVAGGAAGGAYAGLRASEHRKEEWINNEAKKLGIKAYGGGLQRRYENADAEVTDEDGNKVGSSARLLRNVPMGDWANMILMQSNPMYGMDPSMVRFPYLHNRIITTPRPNVTLPNPFGDRANEILSRPVEDYSWGNYVNWPFVPNSFMNYGKTDETDTADKTQFPLQITGGTPVPETFVPGYQGIYWPREGVGAAASADADSIGSSTPSDSTTTVPPVITQQPTSGGGSDRTGLTTTTPPAATPNTSDVSPTPVDFDTLNRILGINQPRTAPDLSRIDTTVPDEQFDETLPSTSGSSVGRQGVVNYATFPRYSGALLSSALALNALAQDPDKYSFQPVNPAMAEGEMPVQLQRYMPVDVNIPINEIRAQGNAANRAIANAGLGPSTGANLIANNAATNNAIGTGFLQAYQANNQQRNQVITANNAALAQQAAFNQQRNLANAQARNMANLYNQRMALQVQQLNNQAEQDKYNAVGINLNNMAEALSGIGRENFVMNQINNNPALLQYLFPGGRTAPKKNGGKIKTKKK